MAYDRLPRLGLAGGVTTLLVYVDNIVVAGDDLQGIEALKRSLLQEFEIKELGRLKYFLGIEVAHSRHGIFISQQKPNRAYVVGVVSQFMHNPNVHLRAAHRILQYLKGALGNEVSFKRSNELTLEACMDVDYARSIDDRRLTSSYCKFLGGNLVTWKCKK
ncbi:Retrovirus-related Pol polyprotein from transposon RE1 [Vitis vinifera]|uniref:Retrovirus-related Pol polyprotein from transposon RE1 n=1 Tax=Vitis vinifera TaxID=29760 RepID=A0A438FUB5_VITVI|nr:Retrovirus-related Pol polyprotein from transposon RE1 [Vitis vinifera]RVW63549.1 Retrovirus-related Pol polyprotein from transposon RE1 [Vitis vinifera]RVW68171.1 Retrovirus-related Pol polyprotein from transposon RE1 [Vitis vinifera]